MKKIKYILVAFLVMFSLVCLSSCNGNNKTTTTQTKELPTDELTSYFDSIKSNMSSVYYVVTTATVKDSGVTVYINKTTITISDSTTLSGNTQIDKSTLNSSFKLEKNTTQTSFSNLDPSTLFNYVVSTTLLESSDVNTKDDVVTITGVVKKDSASTFFNSSSLVVSENPTFTFVLTSGKITSLNCNYVMNGKNVEVVTSYVYL